MVERGAVLHAEGDLSLRAASIQIDGEIVAGPPVVVGMGPGKAVEGMVIVHRRRAPRSTAV